MLTLAKLCGSILLALNNTAQTPRASGGIGRLAGFRCQCSQGRAGSTPASRTKKKSTALRCFSFWVSLPLVVSPSGILMLGVGKAAPAQLLLLRKSNLRRKSAAPPCGAPASEQSSLCSLRLPPVAQVYSASIPSLAKKTRLCRVFLFSFIPWSIQQICKQKKNDPRPVFQSGVILRSAWALPSVINLSFYRFSVPIILSRCFDSHLYQRTVCGSLPYMTTAFGELASLDVGSFPVFNFRGESLVHWTHPFCI